MPLPGISKVFSNLSIFHPLKLHKPYIIINNNNNNTTNKYLILSSATITTTTTTTTTITKSSTRTRRIYSNYSGARLRMTIPYAPVAAQFPNSNTIRRSTSTNNYNNNNNKDRDLVTTDFDIRMRSTTSTNGKIDNMSENDIVSTPTQKLLTLPTILTLGRVAAVPLLVGTFYVESWWGPTATTGIFLAAAITDWLDGYLARRMNLGTQFGAFLDPVADKLMVAATLILLCTKPFDAGMFGQAPWLLTVPAIAIIGREITMSAVREWAASQDKKLLEAVAVNNLGKWKTASQMVALTILLASRDSSFVVAGSLVSSGVVLLYISAWLALWSLVVYMRKIWKVLLR